MSKLPLSVRQAEVAALVARGYPDKMIAHETGLSIYTVRQHIKDGAGRLPGEGWPRQRLTLWFLRLSDGE